jgi:hypothetical protein
VQPDLFVPDDDWGPYPASLQAASLQVASLQVEADLLHKEARWLHGEALRLLAAGNLALARDYHERQRQLLHAAANVWVAARRKR